MKIFFLILSLAAIVFAWAEFDRLVAAAVSLFVIMLWAVYEGDEIKMKRRGKL